MPRRQRERLLRSADVIPQFLNHAKFFRDGKPSKMFYFRMHSSTSQVLGLPRGIRCGRNNPVRIHHGPLISIDPASRRVKQGFRLQVSDRNVPDHAGGARDLTTGEDVAAASRASDGYDLRLPPADAPPCHAVDGCPAGGGSYVAIRIDVRTWTNPSRRHADVRRPAQSRSVSAPSTSDRFSMWRPGFDRNDGVDRAAAK